jgi:SAM-dependent methyltransferase
VSEPPRPPGGLVRKLAQRYLPADVRRRGWNRYRQIRSWPPVGLGRLGMKRLAPVSKEFGFERGKPIDRYYIEDFLRRHAGMREYAPGVVRGTVLEVGEAQYAERFADQARLERIDILDASPTNPRATVIADLTDAPELESDTYDCVICTQTLLLIYDVRAAVGTLHRVLKPGGTLLVTVPGVSQICHPDMESWGDFWRFTSLSARRLFEEFFDPSEVTVETFGNVLTASAFLYGLAVQDLRKSQLDVRDPDYQVLIAVKAVKAGAGSETPASRPADPA